MTTRQSKMAMFKYCESSYKRTIDNLYSWKNYDEMIAFDHYRANARKLHQRILRYKAGADIQTFDLLFSNARNRLEFMQAIGVENLYHYGKIRSFDWHMVQLIYQAFMVRK